MLVNIIQNTISSFRSALAAAEVITTNLKMWLGFETSETLGTEKVVDGDFSSSVNWADSGNQWVINNNTATYTGDGTANDLLQEISFIGGRTYEIKIDVASIGGTLKVRFDNDQANKAEFSQTGIQTLYITATGSGNITDDLSISREPGVFNAVLNSVSVKELTQITPDKSGNNNVGELFTGKALDFDGSTEYVNTTGFEMAGTSFTFAFWIYPKATTYQFIMDLDVVGTDQRSILALYNNVEGTLVQKFGWYNNPGGFRQFGDPIQNEWQRVVFRVNATTVECYVNGVQSGTTQSLATAHNYSNINNSVIGGRNNLGATQRLDSNLSDFQIYNAYWSTDDIAFDYANPNILVTDSTNTGTSIAVTNLKAYWAMSEGDGLIAYDSGTNLEEEEVVDGDFPLPNVNWTVGTKWTIANNAARLVSTNSTGSGLEQSSVFEIGKTYNLIFDATVIQGSAKVEGASGSTLLVIDETKTYNFTFIADRTNLYFNRDAYNSDVTISNVSVREVTASDHGGLIVGAEYVDAQPRIPQLGMQNWSKGSNLVTYSEDFSEWTNQQITVIPNATTSPIGSGNATKIIATTVSTTHQINILNLVASSTCVASIYAKAAGSNTFEVLDGSSAVNGAFFDLATESVTNKGTGIGTIESVGDGWYRCSTVMATTGFRIYQPSSISPISGDGNSGIYIWGAQLEQSSSAGAYRLTDGGATLNSTVIPNPTIPTKDILGNLVRDRLNSFNLDGSGYAEVADEDSINPTTEITIQCWIQSNTETDKGLVAKWVSTTKDYMLYKTTNKFSLYIGTTPLQSGTLPSSGWVNIAGTYNGSTMKTFINGVESTTQAKTGAIPNNDNVLEIGRYAENNIYSYSERISDVLLYDTALDANEIENNYNAGLSAHTN